MGRIFKIVGIVIGLFFVLIVGLILAAILFINPNDYKEEIAQKASKELGHTVKLEGPLDMQLFPWLGLSAQNVTVESSNPISDKTLASIGDLQFKVKTLPLLKKDVQLDKIIVSKATIHLIRDKNGQTNWEPKQAKAPEPQTTQESQPSEAPSQQPEAPADKEAIAFKISGIELTDSHVSFDDRKENQTFEAKNLSFVTGSIEKNEPIDISGHFELHMNQDDNQVENVTDFKATLNVGTFTASLTNVNLTTVITNKELPVSPLNAEFEGDIHANILEAKVDFSNLKLKADQSTAMGDATFSWKNGPHVDFKVKVDTFNADRYMASYSTETQVASAEPQTMTNHAPSNDSIKLIADSPQSISYKGDITLDSLKAKGMSFSNIQLTAQSHPQGLMLNPLSTNLYQGSFKGQSLVNFKNKSTSVKGNLNQIDISKLLKAISGDAKLSGAGNADVNLVIGPSGLNGVTKLSFRNGFIEGVDLDYYLKRARVQLKALDAFLGDPDLSDISSDKVSDRKRTDYDSITATLNANNNVLTNGDLRMETNDMSVTGDGMIDLNKQYIKYKFFVKRKYNDGKKHPNALPLAVRVKGPFNDIKVTPDVDAYIQAMLKQKAEGAIIEQLDKALGGDGANSIEDAIEDKLEKEVEKGLKKLFKF